MRQIKINHEVGLPIFVGCSIVALWIYCILASFLGWIEAIWWGGKAMLVPILGSVLLFFCGLLFYWIIASLGQRLKPVNYYHIAFIGIALGFSFFPALELFAYFEEKKLIPFMNPPFSIILWIVVNMAIAFLLNVFVIWMMKLLSKENDLKEES